MIKTVLLSIGRMTGAGVLASILLAFGAVFILISAFLSAGSANGFLERGNVIVQWGGTILMGSLIVAAFGAQQTGRPAMSIFFTFMSVFFAQASLNAGWKYAEVESLKAEAQIEATIKTIGLQADDSAADIQTKAAMATAVQKAAANLEAAERRLTEAQAAIQTRTPPQPSSELDALRADLATYRSQLDCETYGPQGASECRGKDGVIIRTKQRPGDRAEALREIMIPETLARVSALEKDHAAAMTRYQNWLAGKDDGLPALEAEVAAAREAMSTANGNLAAFTSAPKPAAPAEPKELELTAKEGVVEEYAFQDNPEKPSGWVEWAFGEMFQSSEFHWGAVAAPAIEHNLGLSDMRIAALGDGADAATVEEYRKAKEFRVGLLFWAVAGANDIAALLCLAAGLQLLGVQPKKRRSQGLIFIVSEAVRETLWGTSATIKAQLAAARSEAAEAKAAADEAEAKMRAVRDEAEKEAGNRLTIALQEEREKHKAEVEALRAQIARERQNFLPDPLENPNLITEENFDAALLKRFRDLMKTNDVRHRRVLQSLEPPTYVNAITAIYRGEEIEFKARPRNAVVKYLHLWIELDRETPTMSRPRPVGPIAPARGGAA